MHFVIHLRTPLRKKEKIVQTNQTEVCFSLFFSSGRNLFLEFQYVSKNSTKHLVILRVVQAKFEGGCFVLFFLKKGMETQGPGRQKQILKPTATRLC